MGVTAIATPAALPGRAAAHFTSIRAPGSWYSFSTVDKDGQTTGIVQATSNQSEWVPCVVPLAGTFDRLQLRHTAGTTGTLTRVALYYPHPRSVTDDQETADGWPTGAPILDSGAMATAGAGIAEYVFPAPFAWAAGQILWLWIARASTSGATVYQHSAYGTPSAAASTGQPVSGVRIETTGRVPADPPPNLGAGAYDLGAALSLGFADSVMFRLQP